MLPFPSPVFLPFSEHKDLLASDMAQICDMTQLQPQLLVELPGHSRNALRGRSPCSEPGAALHGRCLWQEQSLEEEDQGNRANFIPWKNIYNMVLLYTIYQKKAFVGFTAQACAGF